MDGTAPDGTQAHQGISREDLLDLFIDPYSTIAQNAVKIFDTPLSVNDPMATYTGIATAMQGIGNFGGYSSAAMQQRQMASYQHMLAQQHYRRMKMSGEWASATASATIYPEYNVYGPNAYQRVKPVEPEKVETVPPQMYVTKRLNWCTIYWVCMGLAVTMIPVICA